MPLITLLCLSQLKSLKFSVFHDDDAVFSSAPGEGALGLHFINLKQPLVSFVIEFLGV